MSLWFLLYCNLVLINKFIYIYSEWDSKNAPSVTINHLFLKTSYFLSTTVEWNKVDSNIRTFVTPYSTRESWNLLDQYFEIFRSNISHQVTRKFKPIV